MLSADFCCSHSTSIQYIFNFVVSSKSSALLVDNALHQNELLQSEREKQIAKQTVKIKSSGESSVLQTKIMELKSSKGSLQPYGKDMVEHTQSAESKEKGKVYCIYIANFQNN